MTADTVGFRKVPETYKHPAPDAFVDYWLSMQSQAREATGAIARGEPLQRLEGDWDKESGTFKSFGPNQAQQATWQEFKEFKDVDPQQYMDNPGLRVAIDRAIWRRHYDHTGGDVQKTIRNWNGDSKDGEEYARDVMAYASKNAKDPAPIAAPYGRVETTGIADIPVPTKAALRPRSPQPTRLEDIDPGMVKGRGNRPLIVSEALPPVNMFGEAPPSLRKLGIAILPGMAQDVEDMQDTQEYYRNKLTKGDKDLTGSADEDEFTVNKILRANEGNNMANKQPTNWWDDITKLLTPSNDVISMGSPATQDRKTVAGKTFVPWTFKQQQDTKFNLPPIKAAETKAWTDAYRKKHPNATPLEVSTAFNNYYNAIGKGKDMQGHYPNEATDYSEIPTAKEEEEGSWFDSISPKQADILQELGKRIAGGPNLFSKKRFGKVGADILSGTREALKKSASSQAAAQLAQRKSLNETTMASAALMKALNSGKLSQGDLIKAVADSFKGDPTFIGSTQSDQQKMIMQRARDYQEASNQSGKAAAAHTIRIKPQ